MPLTILIADVGTRQMLQSEYRALLLTEVRPYLQPLSAVAAQNNTSLLHLTLREQQIVLLLTHGLFNAEITTRLHLSPRTVEKYVSSLLRKTTTSNRAELVSAMKNHRL